MLLGLNSDPQHRIPLSTIVASHAKYIRFPIRNGRDYRPFVARLQAKGIEPIIILTDEWLTTSERNTPSFEDRWARAARRAANAYPTVRFTQVGNEVDIEGESSETRPAAEYSTMLRLCAEEIHWRAGRTNTPVTIISAGAANGFPYYWDDVDLTPADIFALHMATRTAADMPARVEQYRYLGKPIAVTEFYSEHADRAEQGREVSAMIRALGRSNVEMAIFYALSDRQYPGGGLVDDHNNAWDAFAAFADAA